jgi:hypothetical protein
MQPRVIQPFIVLFSLALSGALMTSVASAATFTGSAHALLSNVVTKTAMKASLHFIDTTTTAKGKEVITGEISAPEAEESVAVGSTVFSVIFVGGVVYVHGSKTSLESALELSTKEATTLATKWVSVPSTDSAFASVVSSLKITSEFNTYIPSSHMKELKPRKIDGKKVIPLTGKPTTKTATRGNGSVTLFVGANSHLPVAGTLVAQRANKVVREEAVFSDWGQPITVTAPSGAVTIVTVLT